MAQSDPPGVMETSGELPRPFRVVLFCGGPGLERAVVELVSRLEKHREIEFLGGFCQSPGQGLRARAEDLWKRRGALGLAVLLADTLSALIRTCMHPRSELALHRRAGHVSSRVQMVPDLHANEVLERVRRLDADLALVYGGPILRPGLFELPRYGTLGIHHGKVPEYRGKKTTFWAMYNDEPSAGVTIQRLNRGIDTGDVVADGAVAIGGRSLGTVWRELEALGLELYLQAVLDIKRGRACFRPQPSKRGRVYRDPGALDLLRFSWKQLTRYVKARL